MLVNKSLCLTLSPLETAVLVGGLRVLSANMGGSQCQ